MTPKKPAAEDRSLLAVAFGAVVDRRLVASGRTRADLGVYLKPDYKPDSRYSWVYKFLMVQDFPGRQFSDVAAFLGISQGDLLREIADWLDKHGA